MKKTTEVLIIGGGITGCGVLFDLAQRGFKCLLLERGGLSNGTSGRFHGLLHSGARYAVKDTGTARECMAENMILRRIIPHAVEDTGGFFVALPDSPPDYVDVFYAACQQADIPVEEISAAEALRHEPLLNLDLTRCFVVPDGSVETWEACQTLLDAAAAYGAEAMLYHQVVDILVDHSRVTGVMARNVITDEQVVIDCDLVVNAAGPWSGQVARLAGCKVTVHAGKGTMVAMNYRLANTVINHCGPPGDGDILVPVGSVAVIGTTSVSVPDPDNYAIEDWEIQKMLDNGARLIPSFKQFRPLRAWAGVRPLYQEDSLRQEKEAGPDLRQVTRNHALLDHTTLDGVDNFITITGGKWTTYRLMAEQAADLTCQKLGIERPGRTADTVLSPPTKRRFHTLGRRLEKQEQGEAAEQLICECELVTRPQIEAGLTRHNRHIINDLRRDLRVGMGPCQGGFCTYRVAGIMQEQQNVPARQINKALVDFLQERWKGMLPVMWGQNLRQMQLDQGIYLGLLGLDKLPPELSGLDDGRVGELATEGYFEAE
jgi:glycerol-3-phosphate dehydrogenase